MPKRYVRVSPDNVTAEVAQIAKEAAANIPIEGVDKNPEARPNETNRQFRRRMMKARATATGKGLTTQDNDRLYHEAFALFMGGIGETKRPTVIEVGSHLKMHLPSLLQTSIDQHWEIKRAQQEAAGDIAQSEIRLQVARRVDRAVLAGAEPIILKACQAYQDIIFKISEQSTNPEDYVPKAALVEPSDGLPIPSPDKKKFPQLLESKLLRTKAAALNEAVGGFMDMAERARSLGLIVVPEKPGKGDDSPRTLGGTRLLGVNLILQEAAAPEKNVTPIPADHATA